ncbi:MAG TPA: biosynthetic arginine decarboxylase [bacterium]|nr:biosynthetic arginine decarboxylase [bacterium]
MANWTIEDSKKLYNIDKWGSGYFNINKKGHISVYPYANSKNSIDLKLLIDDLIKRKINPPILLRFMNILEDRIIKINKAFRAAIEENSYKANYQTFYPIKVNQQKEVVDAIAKYGKKYNIGLEVGSKPELIAALYIAVDKNIPIICNGYKDKEFIETILFSSKIGFDITIIVEKLFELDIIINLCKKFGIKPKLGIRVKLSSKGTGRWSSSGGVDAKFGLRIKEIITAIDILKKNDLINSLQLLHYHIGSQITKIDKIKNAIIEATRIYVEMKKMGVNLKYLNIGGGLGVDYSGLKSSHFSSVNYTIEEYANDIIFQIKSICDETKTDYPNIISESGRATVAHYSVLITNILNTNGSINSNDDDEIEININKFSPTLKKLYDIYESIDKYSLREDFHDTIQLITEVNSLFNLGYLTLKERATAETLYNKIIKKIENLLEKIEDIPEELRDFKVNLRETYFANFSIFQSLPDSWAIDQLFPISPIQRLNEKPEYIASIADITCDSDGEITQFVVNESIKNYLPVHKINENENYYIGFFLIGAYQEILGDLHNLFGDTNAVHITFNKKTGYNIVNIILGDAIGKTLNYVQYNQYDILKNIRENLEKNVQKQKITIEESTHFYELIEQNLKTYTYLTE